MSTIKYTSGFEMIRHSVPVIYRFFSIILFLIISLPFSCHRYEENSRVNQLNTLLNFNNLKLRQQIPLKFPTCHVQGLEVTGQFYFITSVDTKQNRAWLFKINRKDSRLISKKELTDGVLIHPGGLQYDGRFLWVPNAEYKRESKTKVYGLDPDTLEIRTLFEVSDHIGAVASDGKNFIYGVNWDALHFYTWDINGHQLNKVDSPTSMAYQDIKYFAGKLLCGGHKGDVSAVDVIDPEKWTLVKRIDMPKDRRRSNPTREGMAFDGNLYFLPDDGPDSRILKFTID
ncbi:MAG: hypothetical protein JW837_18485 [Sedimentisphaerales bacterium]|nr:hypothetical protein [Sedimentisphaerales bacterium]